MKLFVASIINKVKTGGVASVIGAHEKHLRALGVEYVANEKAADLVIVHAMAERDSRVDVYHSHGFYPTAVENWGPRFEQVNQRLINYVMAARVVVAVSELAAEVMRRDLHIQPHIIRNGVDFREINQGGDAKGYILWPKIQPTPTCDPAPLKWLAENTKLPLASMANVVGNVKSFGVLPRGEFLKMLRGCSIYLGTTRENNPMAVMESLAIGVPLVGYDWGFNREWLQSGNGCELVEPGDLEGLARAIEKVRNNWQVYSKQAVEFAKLNFGWEQPIREIYELYKSLLDPVPTCAVSVVIPLHNYAHWIGAAIQSVKEQTSLPLEIIVVDDASTDNPTIPEGVKCIKLDVNVGVAEARNIGIGQAQGDSILCLDADDMLVKDYIERALPRFADPRVGIVYGSLGLMDERGRSIGKRWFDAPFSYQEQIIGHNRVPTCCMFRKEAWRRAGEFRKYESPAEDAGLWTRIASQGWRIDFINDRRTTLHYRMHDDSLSRRVRFPDWASGQEWKNRSSGVGKPINIYDCPKVSFVIDYRIKSELDFIRTLDSIEGMKAIDWEICAVGVPTPRVKDGWPFVRWNKESTAPIQVFLEAGEIMTDAEWGKIIERGEFPA